MYKLRHGEDAWKRAVQSVARHTELAKTVERPISRAYFKLIEIARTTAIVAPRTSLHLCEAPGGFAGGSVRVSRLRARLRGVAVQREEDANRVGAVLFQLPSPTGEGCALRRGGR